MSIQSPAKYEIRSVIRYLVWKGKTPVEVHNEVKTAYGDKGMNRTSVFKWCREFKNGRTSVHDDQRSGRPSILCPSEAKWRPLVTLEDLREETNLLQIHWESERARLCSVIARGSPRYKRDNAAAAAAPLRRATTTRKSGYAK
ncbi:GVQW3 protein, partial [Pseudoatta argentina]